MKTVFFSVNSKFVHTLLAPRYLSAGSKEITEIFETNINVKLYENLAAIYKMRPDVIAVSCYIFNAEYVTAFMKEIKKLLPEAIIVAGGYEAQYDIAKYLTLADYILCGEGDVRFGELLSDLASGKKPEN